MYNNFAGLRLHGQELDFGSELSKWVLKEPRFLVFLKLKLTPQVKSLNFCFVFSRIPMQLSGVSDTSPHDDSTSSADADKPARRV